MDPITTALSGVLLPAVLSGVLLAIGWRVWRRDGAGVDGRWAGALALAAAFLAAFVAIASPPKGLLPGSEQTPTGLDWLFLIVAVAGVLFAFSDPVLWRRLLLRIAASALTVWLVLRNAFEHQLEGNEAIGWFAGLVALLALVWTAAEYRARRSGASSPLVWWATAAALAGVAGLSGSLKIAQLSGAVAAGLGAAVVLAWWRPRLSLAGGGIALASLLCFGLGLNAHFYSYTTGADVLLIAAAPIAPFLRVLPGLSRFEGGRRTLVELALAGIPLAIALVRAGLAYEPDPYADYY